MKHQPKPLPPKPARGRKPIYGTRMVLIAARIPIYQCLFLARVGPDLSAALRAIIEKAIKDANSN